MADDQGYELVNRLSESLIRTLLTVNGGAAVATLGFAGDLIGRDPQIISANELACSMMFYIAGVVLSVLSFGFLQLFHMFDREWVNLSYSEKCKQLMRFFAYFAGFASIAMFIGGSLTTANAIAG